jgi:signal transduction histidine kinase
MIAKRNFLFMIVGWFFLQTALSCVSFFALVVTPDQGFALTDTPLGALSNAQINQPAVNKQGQRLPFRIPPQEAIEACDGKREGDSCTFNSQHGILDGECHAGVENVFACRPHPGLPPPEINRGIIPENRIGSRGTSQPSTRTLTKAGSEPGKQVEPSPGQKSGNMVSPQDKELPGRQIQTGPALPVEHPAQPPTPKGFFYDKLGQYVGDLGSHLVVAIIAAGLIWYVFFRYSTVPLRRLRKVTQQLAGGNLSARVGEGLIHRKDEVADLGRDVDRMAERIERLVGAQQRLIRDVSHELRSPLARLNVALELARQSAGLAHSAPFDRIERESERLNELISQLLMLTKLENESVMTKRMEFDIAALVAEIAKDVDFEASSKNRRVVTKACESLMLNGNQELLRQALENLIRNAARYTTEGTEVEISLSKKNLGGRVFAHIEIRDHGPGVPESELNDIFRPFYRVNDARERQSGGAGVGLAIAERAVHLHGGSLRALNAPDAGLIVEMELPLT